jgi:hypothetical protein
MAKKLTLAQVAKRAREKDPKAWKALAPRERRILVEQLNQHAGQEAPRPAHFARLDRFPLIESRYLIASSSVITPGSLCAGRHTASSE